MEITHDQHESYLDVDSHSYHLFIEFLTPDTKMATKLLEVAFRSFQAKFRLTKRKMFIIMDLETLLIGQYVITENHLCKTQTNKK